MITPLAIDLYCGLGGWTEGLLAAGYNVVGFDIQRHQYGDNKYPAQLVLQDILTVHGSQFKDAAVIVASPPCQNYSYLAMPWSKSTDPNNSKAAKALRKKWETEGPDNRLFDACFRIREEAMEATRELCEACDGAGCRNDAIGCRECTGSGLGPPRYIPLIVENVRGAVEWVGPQKAKYGSFYLWGDVEQVGDRILAGADIGKFGAVGLAPGDGVKCGGSAGDDWFAHHNRDSFGVKVRTEGEGRRTDVGNEVRFTSRDCGIEGTKIGGDWFSDPNSTCRKHGSRSNARKAASAMIAVIPYPLALYIARVFHPEYATATKTNLFRVPELRGSGYPKTESSTS